jgi:beta-N-acetylhexosaminidase
MLKQLLSLPIEKKVGQLFFIGLPGVELDKETQALLEEISPGGICLFARNIHSAEKTRKFLDDIREISSVEPFFSIDEEGGRVDRLRRIVTPLPPANLIKTTEQAKTLGQITADILRMLGFNMNFAPVVDVIDEERGNFPNGLYSRTFGNSKEKVVELTGTYLNTLQKAGCLGCLKHFPGLGASVTDSHENLPTVDLTRKDLFGVDLFPYQNLLQTLQVHAVMVAHATFPKLDLQETDSDGKLLPSSLGRKFVSQLLRYELKFNGLVITDDLEMGAIVKNYTIGKACKLAIAAGEDMLAICANPDAIREGYFALLDGVKKGEFSVVRIDESLERIAYVKCQTQPPIPLENQRLNKLSEQIVELNKQVNNNYGG